MSVYLKQIELGPMQNFAYLLGDPARKVCWIVDPAWNFQEAWEAAGRDGFSIDAVLLTHSHYDHCNALESREFPKALPVYLHEEERTFAASVDARGLCPRLPEKQLRTVRAGETLTLGSLSIVCLHTPGHTPGGVCYLAGSDLLTGDTLFVDTCGRTDLPGGDMEGLRHSLHQVLAPVDDSVTVWPGHNYSELPHDTLGRIRQENPFYTTFRRTGRDRNLPL
ncbi:MAG TPA: MBL fold metallo-hydrolase [Elusimicrobiota bacterium]|nr:MBL fold metallo-hydrolase [Elusimicrobiota bacterium]